MFFFFGLRPHSLPPFFPTFRTSKLEHYINLCLIKLIIILLINENYNYKHMVAIQGNNLYDKLFNPFDSLFL
jgi:hypothetical protein